MTYEQNVDEDTLATSLEESLAVVAEESSNKPNDDRDLITKWRDWTGSTLDHLDKREDDVRSRLVEARRTRDDMITRAHEIFAVAKMEAMAEVKQIDTTREAMRMAHGHLKAEAL